MSGGLRERRRQAIRRELSEAAIRLFLAQGFANTTVDQIVAPLGVSRRTLFRHFATKEDLVFVWYDALADELAAACAARPSGETPYDAVCAALSGVLRSHHKNQDRVKSMLALAGETPSLAAKCVEKRAMWQDRLAAVLAPRWGADPHRDLFARIVAGAAINAFALAVDDWFRNGPEDGLYQTVERALRCGGNVSEACGDRSTEEARPDPQDRRAKRPAAAVVARLS